MGKSYINPAIRVKRGNARTRPFTKTIAAVQFRKTEAGKKYYKKSRKLTNKAVRYGAQMLKEKVPKFALAQYNPFNRECFDVRIPDMNTMPSSSLFDLQETTISINSTGQAACTAFLPVLQCQSVVATPASANSWTWSASYGGGVASSRASTVVSQFGLIRAVAHGIRISCPSALLNTTGTVHIAVWPTSTLTGQYTTWAFPTSISQMSELPYYQRISLGSICSNTVTIVNKFVDESAFQYRDPNFGVGPSAGNAENTINGWAQIFICVDAAQSSAVALNVEMITHYEAISNSFGIGTDRPCECPDPIVCSATAAAASQTNPVRNGNEGDGVDASFSRAFNQAMGRIPPSLWNFAASAAGTSAAAGMNRLLNNDVPDYFIHRVMENGGY